MMYQFMFSSIIWITILHKAIGTECVKCAECSIPPQIQFYLPDYEKKCINSECNNATSATNATNVMFGPCPNDPTDHRINRCGTLRGSVKLSVLSFGGHVDTVTFYLRDCFAVKKNTKSGCYTDRNMLNDQKAVIEKKFAYDLKRRKTQVGDIQNGQFCINHSGTNKSCTLMYSSLLFLIILMLALLIT